MQRPFIEAVSQVPEAAREADCHNKRENGCPEVLVEDDQVMRHRRPVLKQLPHPTDDQRLWAVDHRP